MAEPQPQNYNASNPAHIKSRKQREEMEALRSAAALEFVMSSALGRRFVWELLGETGMFRDSFTGNSTTFYNEGRRSVGLKLQEKIEAQQANLFILMWQENLASKDRAAKADAAARINGAVEQIGD
jgi:hypothetical protein